MKGLMVDGSVCKLYKQFIILILECMCNQVLQFSNWKRLQGMGSGWYFCCMGIPNHYRAEDVAMSNKGWCV